MVCRRGRRQAAVAKGSPLSLSLRACVRERHRETEERERHAVSAAARAAPRSRTAARRATPGAAAAAAAALPSHPLLRPQRESLSPALFRGGLLLWGIGLCKCRMPCIYAWWVPRLARRSGGIHELGCEGGSAAVCSIDGGGFNKCGGLVWSLL